MIRVWLLLLSMTMPAYAQTLPALYEVTGVASDDVLNVRTQPDATSEIVGQLLPTAQGIEVVTLSDDQNWGMVGMPEGIGWVSMRFMHLQTAPIPPLYCFGAEPFWGLTIDATKSVLSQLGENSVDLTLMDVTTVPNEYFFTFSQGLDPIDRIANVRREFCSDGMSDRSYGFKTSIYNNETVGGGALIGCCTLQNDNSVLQAEN